MDNVNEIKTEELFVPDSKIDEKQKASGMQSQNPASEDFGTDMKGYKSFKDAGRAKLKGSIQDFLESESRTLPGEASGLKYDLVNEYSATRKNTLKNSVPVLLWMAAAFAFVGIMAGTIISIVHRQNRNIAVEVESFDSLNLSNLLDLVGETQQKINDESASKVSLELKKKNIIAQAESERKSSLATLNSLNIRDSSEKSRMQNEIQASYNAAMETARQLDFQIAESEQRINLYQQQLAQYDTTKVQQAREHQAELASEKKLHQLEKQQLASDYEGKLSDLQKNLDDIQQSAMEKQEEMVGFVKNQYDPTFSDDRTALSIVTKAAASYSSYYSGASSRVDENASEEFKKALEKQRQYYNDISTLGSRFLKIPQKNAIPTFASSMQRIANNAGNELASASVSEVNKLLGKNYELKDRNDGLEEEKKQLSVQIDGLEEEKRELISQTGALTEEKSALESLKETLSAQVETLNVTNGELASENEKLNSTNESLSTRMSELSQSVDSLSKEKESLEASWKTELSRLEESWAAEKSALLAKNESLSQERESVDGLKEANASLVAENASLVSEAEKIRKDYQSAVEEKEKLSSQTRSLVSEKESLVDEKNRLEESNKALSSQNSQYSQLLQALCTKDGNKIQGLVSGVVNKRRVMIYVEKSAYSAYASKAGQGSLVPVTVVRNGKTIAGGKMTIDNGVVYMIKGSEEDQIMVESLFNIEGGNDYSSVSVGDEIRISNPM